MRAVFLHWDEELTNQRQWLGRLGKYDAPELAFLLQLYSLFFDEIYVPANFLTDCNLIPEILDKLGITDSASAIRSNVHPMRILWDDVRFPSDSFTQLLWTSHKEEHDVSYRNPEQLKESMGLCDKYFTSKVVRREIEPDYHRKESMDHLRRDVFNEKRNLSPFLADNHRRLLECLEEIEELAADTPYAYGRNMYYKIFGLSRPNPVSSHMELAARFRPVTQKLTDIERVAFIRSVDYVSHVLKAKFGMRTLGLPEDEACAILMPREFLEYVRYPLQCEAVEQADAVIKVNELVSRGLDQRLVRRMTAEKLNILRESTEYQKFGKALSEVVKAKPETLLDKDREDLQNTFDEYTRKICEVISPGRVAKDYVLRLTVRLCKTDALLSAIVGYSIGQTPGSAVVAAGAQLIANYLGQHIERRYFGRDLWTPQTVVSTTDVRIYLSSGLKDGGASSG